MATRRVVAMLASVAVALGLGGFVGTASAAAPPPNDLIAGATVVPASPFSATLDTTGATTDADDAGVNQDCGAPATNNSVWYKFAAGAKDRLLAVDTTGSTFSSGVIIASGAPGALTTEACGPVTANAGIAPGKTYYILAFDDSGSGGTLHISIHGAGPAPTNDKIGHAAVVSALPFNATLNTTGATTDAVDTQANASCGAPATSNSVWYTFTAGRNHHNIFVDASNSDYSAGVIIATGTPGALTTVSCGPAFVTATTTPGTAYHIMIFDDSDSGGGTLRLHIGDAPSLALTVDKNARIDSHGVVYLTGSYSCTRAKSLHISGTLIEIVANKVVSTGHFDTLGIPAPTCDGSKQSWTGLVLANTTVFGPGQAAAFIDANACGGVACTLISQTTVVKLANRIAGTSSPAPKERLRTRTVPRPSCVGTGMPFTSSPPCGATDTKPSTPIPADTSSNEALVSRFLKPTTVAMLVAAVAGLALGTPEAVAGTACIGKITMKHARLDWAPTRTAAQIATLKPQTTAGVSIQMFTTTVRDAASTFSYKMVGKNPFVAQTEPSTTVVTTLIPTVIMFSNGDTWDPRVIDSCDSQSALTWTQNSPIFVGQPWKFGGTRMGTSQYVDAFQRAEFYSQTNPTTGINPGYHVKLALTTHAPFVLHVPTTDAAESTTVCGTHKLAGVEINYLDTEIQHYIIATLGSAATTTFPLFLLDNVVEYEGTTSRCCALGYHDAMTNAGRLQTYGVSMYDNTGDLSDVRDTAVIGHEVAEWINDPLGNNRTKPWGNIGQVSGCQDNLEVADPLSGAGITDTLNGKTYHLPELAFFSWFYHSSPSLGVNGWFSSNGTFTTSARPCTF